MSRLLTTSKNLASILWQDFINTLHLSDKLPKDKTQRELVKALRKDGIVFFDNFLPAKKCDALAEKLLTLVDSKTKSVELDSGTYINFRNEDVEDGSDQGMVDIFYVNKELPEIDKINIDFVGELLKETECQEVIKLKTHSYVNRGVQGTRTFHIDNTQPVVYKAFIYLTDVKDESYGPYSFIKGSHKLSGTVYKNLIKNFFSSKHHPTDMSSINPKKVMPCIAPKGTLIVSNQNGIHRGLPQDLDKTRVALVFNFTVLSKLSYLHSTARKKLEAAREN